MPVPILYGLLIGGIRILPYAVRYGKDIVRIGYKVIASGKHLKNAKKIFGNKNVIGDITHLARFSTKAEKFSPIRSRQIINLSKSGTEFSKSIASTADDAANQISKFIVGSSTRTVGGTNVATPIRSLFGKNIKFSSQTLKNITKAESGPTALGKEIIKAPVKAGTTVGKPALVAKETVKKTIKEFKEKLVTPKIPVRTGKELATQITTVKDAPWYVAVMPKFLRTTKEVLKRPSDKEALLGKATERIVTPAVHWGRVGTAATLGTVIPAAIGGMTPEEKEAKDTARDLDYNQLFGTTGTNISEDLDVPSAIQTFSE